MGLLHGPNIVTEGLAFYMDAANPNSYKDGDSYVSNIKNSEATGSLEGGVSFNSSNAGCWDFDGDGDYIDLGSVDTSNPLCLYEFPFTLSFWIAASLSGDSYQRIIDKSTDTQGKDGYALSIHDSPSPILHWYIDITTIFAYTFPSYSADQWINIAITQGGGGNNLYIDGELVSSNAIPQAAPFDTVDTRIGSSPSVASREFNGKISNFSVYQRALNLSEIKQNYNALKSRFE